MAMAVTGTIEPISDRGPGQRDDQAGRVEVVGGVGQLLGGTIIGQCATGGGQPLLRPGDPLYQGAWRSSINCPPRMTPASNRADQAFARAVSAWWFFATAGKGAPANSVTAFSRVFTACSCGEGGENSAGDMPMAVPEATPTSAYSPTSTGFNPSWATIVEPPPTMTMKKLPGGGRRNAFCMKVPTVAMLMV